MTKTIVFPFGETNYTFVQVASFFFAVDNVEAVRFANKHFTNLEIKPLKMVMAIAVGVQHQIILEFPNLPKSIIFITQK